MTPVIAPKDQISRIAARLFFQRSYRATGVDTIAAESRIGKKTLDRRYTSEDGLVAACLKDSMASRMFGAENPGAHVAAAARVLVDSAIG